MVSSIVADETDERVYLSSILRNRAVSQSELQRRADQGQHVVPFVLEAHGPIRVLSHELVEQAVIAPLLRSRIRLACCFFMAAVPERLDPGDPLEQHHLRIWPEDDLPRAAPWWVGSQEEPATEEPRGLLRGSETQNPRWIWE